MPMLRALYPPNWLEISRRIRYERAGNLCEWCGAENGKPHPVTGSMVVLTVAHLDHDPSGTDETRMAALCNACHLRYDAPMHARHAAETRRRKKIAAGQREML